MSFLLDTNAISEIRRGRDRNVAAWANSVADRELHLSVLTLGKIRKGIERLGGRDRAQADVFSIWLSELSERFSDRVLAVDARVADEWGLLNAPADRNTIDSLIAATARVHDLTVVTRNTSDFEGCQVKLLDPWKQRPPSSRRGVRMSPPAGAGASVVNTELKHEFSACKRRVSGFESRCGD